MKEENEPLVCPIALTLMYYPFLFQPTCRHKDMQSQVLMETMSRPESPASDFVPGQILLCIDLFQKIKKLSSIFKKVSLYTLRFSK